MSSRIVTLDIPAHQALQELLPWYVNGQLGAQDSERLRLHLQDCATCRAQAEWQRQLHDAAQEAAPPPMPDMEQALSRLLARLPEAESAQPRRPAQVLDTVAASERQSAQLPGTPAVPPPRVTPGQTASEPANEVGENWLRTVAAWLRHWPAPGRWAYPLLAAQAVLILVLAGGHPAPQPDYRGLGAAMAPANAVVLFHPATPERELRRLLRAHGARLAGGPTVTGAYLLQLPAAGRQAALQALRAEAAVQRAEALDGVSSGETP